MLAFAIAASVLFILALAAAVYLFTARRAALRDVARLEADTLTAHATTDKLRCENADLLDQRDAVRQDAARLEERLAEREKVAEERRVELERERAKLIEQTRDTFKALSGEALDEASKRFLKLAEGTFAEKQKDASGQLELRKQAIDAMLKPIRESLDKHQGLLHVIEKQRTGAYAKLEEQVVAMRRLGEDLRGETASLVKALRRPETRGRWGEMQLRRVAELAGMIPHCDFSEQETLRTDAGNLRPDMVVNLPSDRRIVIDAKTPLDAYLDSMECSDDATRLTCLKRHVEHIRKQVHALSAKEYQHHLDRSPGFVVLFIPGEAFLHAALAQDPDLLENAMNRSVLIASPTTLIALLLAVAEGWREEHLAENARTIATLGRELHERIAIAVEHVEKLGKTLENSVKHYNSFVGSLESRVLPTARRFQDLSAGSPKELPAEGKIKQIDHTPREIPSPTP